MLSEPEEGRNPQRAVVADTAGHHGAVVHVSEGGDRWLQDRLRAVIAVPGGFDSHAPPPYLLCSRPIPGLAAVIRAVVTLA
jgi:hypothetical protein